MSNNGPTANSSSNGSIIAIDSYLYSDTERAYIFGAIAVGNLVGTYPFVLLSGLLGLRKTFAIYGLISATAALSTPWLVHFGVWWLVFATFLEGFAAASLFPTRGTITSRWASLKDSGIFVAVLSCGNQLAPIFTMPISGALCVSKAGWPATHYVHGVVTLISMSLFLLFYRDSPREHRCVSEKEITIIENEKSANTGGKQVDVPYRAIVTSLPVWAVFVATFGACFGFQIFVQYGPTYLNKVLHFPIEKTGFVAATPFIFSIIIKVSAGTLSDRGTCLTEKTRIMLFAIAAQGLVAIAYIVLALLPADSAGLAQIAYTAVLAFSGMNCAGPIKSAVLVAGQHVHFIMAIMSVLNCTVILLLPIAITFLVPHNEKTEWKRLFYLACGVIVACCIFFAIFGDSEPAPWSKTGSNKIYKKEDKHVDRVELKT